MAQSNLNGFEHMWRATIATRSCRSTSAIDVLKGFDTTKFDQTVEVAMRLGIDAKQADQLVRGSIVLPHGIGKSQRVIVFAKGDMVAAAEEAGADEVGQEDLAKKIKDGWTRIRRVHRRARHDGSRRSAR